MSQESQAMRRVGDVAPAGEKLDGDMLYVRALVGAEFVVTGIQERRGDNGEYLAVVIELEGKQAFFFTSHQAIVPKLRKCVDDLPLLATITEEVASGTGRKYFDIY